MKTIILILPLIAATAYAVPIEEDAKINAFIKNLLLASEKQDNGIESLFEKATKQEKEQEEKIQSLLAQMQDDDDEDAILQELLALEQGGDIAKIQRRKWWQKAWGKVKGFLNFGVKTSAIPCGPLTFKNLM